MDNDIKLKDGLEVATSDFWYDITRGGYIKPEEMMEDQEMAVRVREAVALVWGFERACKAQIEDFEI